MFAVKWMLNHFTQILEPYKLYFLLYVVVCAFISWAYIFYYGPIKNQRAMSLIEFLLKVAGITLLYFGVSFFEGFIVVLITLAAIKIINKLMELTLVKKIKSDNLLY